MKKQLLFLGLSILFLVSCGSEVTEVKKKAEYIYVEIEECSIPVPKIYKIAKDGNAKPYEHKYHYFGKNFNGKTIVTKKRFEGDYEDLLSFVKKTKTMKLDQEINRTNFKIVTVNSTFDDKITYYLFGIDAYIILSGSNEEELNYTLNYCKKTWKLDKGEHNASTAK